MTRFCPKCKTNTERNKGSNCKPCAKEYAVKWYAAHRDEIKAKTAAYQITHKEKTNKVISIWRAANPDKLKKYYAKYHAKNIKKINTSQSEYRDKNPEKVKAARAAWSKANPEMTRIYVQNRRARQRENGGVLSRDLSSKLFKLQRGKCACCSEPLGKNYHLDHILPIILGGPNIDSNMQLLRQRCNQQKSAKHPVDFMQSRGFLL